MKKIVLKTEACIGCGACVGIDSEHFDFSDDGFSMIKSQDNLDSPALNDAIDACPVAIISIEEMSDNDNVGKLNECTINEECNLNECSCKTNESDCFCENCHCHDDKNENAA